MSSIDIDYLNQIGSDKTQKSIACVNDKKLISQLRITLKNFWQMIKTQFFAYELANFIKSNEFFLQTKGITTTTNYIRGTILLVDFGINAGTELSYEHPCIVIENEYRDIFVVPTSTGVKTTDKNGKMYSCYVPATTGDGFDRNTTVVLNAAKWVSKSRVIKPLGVATPVFFKKVYNELFKFCFRLKNKDIENLEKIKNRLQTEIETLKQQNADLTTELELPKIR